MVHDGKIKGNCLHIVPIKQDPESPIFRLVRESGPKIGNLYIKIKPSGELDEEDLSKKAIEYANEIAIRGYDKDSISVVNISPFTQMFFS